MHAVSILNILGRGALPVTDFKDPANVLETLNVMFESKFHSGMSASVWYGVYDAERRRLKYAAAGLHPAFLVPAARDRAIPLETAAPEIGVKRAFKFGASRIDVAPSSSLYVFSDGAFAYAMKDGSEGTLESFVSLLLAPPVDGRTEPQRLLAEARARALSEDLEDDFALMAFKFL
jgi:serine phosphatase RsbU (regulator of sigma subunit)